MRTAASQSVAEPDRSACSRGKALEEGVVSRSSQTAPDVRHRSQQP